MSSTTTQSRKGHRKDWHWPALVLLLFFSIVNSSLAQTQVVSFSYTGSIVTWPVPAGVTSLTIEARGAEGGDTEDRRATAGKGAIVAALVSVTPGQTLSVLVGQSLNGRSAGGGGSFVVGPATGATPTPLVIAGGGGGASTINGNTDAKHGQSGTSGGRGGFAFSGNNNNPGDGGTNGSGGGSGANGAGGGGGFTGNGGGNSTYPNAGGRSFTNGGAGGSAAVNGSYGGGGSSDEGVTSGGGGGGYSGGGAGYTGVGGGGGSFTAGTRLFARTGNTDGNSGNGQVIITYALPCTSSYVVTSTADSGPGTLREAMNSIAATSCPGPFTITASVSGTINLASVLPDITKDIAFIGPGASNLTVQRNTGGNYRIFNILPDTNDGSENIVSFNGFTIADGFADQASGGGINNDGSSLTLTDCLFRNNRTTNDGGAIITTHPLTINSCSFIGNSAESAGSEGGAIFQNGSSINVTNTLFSSNTNVGGGAGITSAFGPATITNCLFTANSGFYGGGISFRNGSTGLITNCTFSGNRATAQGNAVGLGADASATLINTTITGNMGNEGAIFTNSSGALVLKNCIVAGNSAIANPDISGPSAVDASSSYNVIGTGGSGGLTNGVNNNIVGVDALLAPLANYGGSLLTHALLPGSPAINAGTSSGAPTTDQRGIGRVGVTDVGAFESQGFTLALTSGNNQTATVGTAFANPLVVTVGSTNGEPVAGGRVTYSGPASGASINPVSVTATITGTTASVPVTANATAGGPYIVAASTQGASTTVSFNLTNTPSAPTVTGFAATSTSVCVGQPVSFTANLGSVNGGYTYTLSDGNAAISGPGSGTAFSQSLTVLNTGLRTFTLVVTSNGQSASATASVNVNPIPTPSLSATPGTTLNCSQNSLTLTAGGGTTYAFSGPGVVSQNPTAGTAVVNASGTYSVSVTASGCSSTTSIQIYQDNAVPSISISPASATLSCTNPTVSLSAVGSNGTYQWSTGATSSVISATSAGMYSVTVTATNGCTATATAQVFQDNVAPSVSINPASATLSCTNTSVSLTASGNGTYQWSTGATSPTISVTTAGTYSVTLTASNGCVSSTSAQVVQDNTQPTVVITANPSLTIAQGQSTMLTASGATSYAWSTGASTTSIVVNTPGQYSVTGTTGSCQGVATVTVVPAGNFAITDVTTNNCQQIAVNRYVISFTPVYVGSNGQPISFSVVNEIFPTTAPGPYTLQLYTDNPVIVLKANQPGNPGEASYTYNWLATCSSPMPNTPPRLNQPIPNQTAKVGDAFGYTIPQLTFTDNETPASLTLSVGGLPAGLNFTQPNQIGGVPNVAGVSSVSVTATDPGGLTVTTTFMLTVVQPASDNTPPTVANPVANQTASQGQPFSLNVSATFTDAQTPNALTLTSSQLPAGLSLVNGVISGTPTQPGTTNVTLTATDPGGLSASTSFGLTVQPTPSGGSFAITSVTTNNCQQIASNRYAISFTPVYSGTNGQPISFSVVNELFPTTDPGPYSLQLYNDNPSIVLKASQNGTPGETSYRYDWLAACSSPAPNTPPRVNQPLTNQTARVGQAFGYTIPQLTFTDNETPTTLTLSVSGLPAGLSFSPPTQIGGVPSVSGVSSVTVTATDPSGLSVSTTFSLTVLPANAPVGFAITDVQTLSCVTISANRRSLTFQPQYSNTTSEPISFSVVNEMLPTTNPGPYTLQLYTDNPVLQLRAQQGTSQASFAYNWLAACSSAARQGVVEAGTGLQVKVLGNPVESEQIRLAIQGVAGESVTVHLVDQQGKRVAQQRISQAGPIEQVSIPVGNSRGLLVLYVETDTQRQQLKVVVK
ncbi:hypothetical protein GCM10027592_32050 [Spirosoma flavus]